MVARPLVFGPTVALPPDTAFLVEGGFVQERGCTPTPATGCATWPEALDRVLVRSDGQVKVERLLDAGNLVTRRPFPDVLGPHFAARPDGSEIMVGICSVGYCRGYHATPYKDGEVTLFRSRDGGIRWEEIGRVEGTPGERVWLWLWYLTNDGIVLSYELENPASTGTTSSARYEYSYVYAYVDGSP